MNRNTIYFKDGDDTIIHCEGGMPSKFWQSGNGNFKSKSSHPYNYDPILIWGVEEAETSGSLYTDRLLMWDHEKHNTLCKKHFGDEGQYWNNRDPKLIEAFLQDWHENPELSLVYITEFCNASNGYPCWLLGFNDS